MSKLISAELHRITLAENREAHTPESLCFSLSAQLKSGLVLITRERCLLCVCLTLSELCFLSIVTFIEVYLYSPKYDLRQKMSEYFLKCCLDSLSGHPGLYGSYFIFTYVAL